MTSNDTHTVPPTHADAATDIIPFLDLPLPQHLPALFRKKSSAVWLLRQRNANGLASIIHFIGRTAYVSKAEFVTWFRARPALPTNADAARSAPARVSRARGTNVGRRSDAAPRRRS